LDPSRHTVQSELRTSILNIEKSWLCFLPNGWCYAINFELFLFSWNLTCVYMSFKSIFIW
jgi:hypothetical protein